MSFMRNRFLRSAYDELVVVGSRWTRVLAVSVDAAEVGPPHVQSHLAHPIITVIPTLHVAGIKFYDRVLEYIDHAVKRNKDTLVLLEGICDSEAAEKQQMQEYQDIMRNDALRQTMLAKADDNTLYSPEVMREICQEMDIRYELLQSMESTVRLQECYLKPKLAAMCGLNLRNHADLHMHEVQRLLEEESVRLQTLGERLPSSIAVSQLGSFPVIRKHRERKVAQVARMHCIRWFEQETDGEVIIPWGYFHTEAIIHYILEGNKSVSAAVDTNGGGVASSTGTSSSAGAASPSDEASTRSSTGPGRLSAKAAAAGGVAGAAAAIEHAPPRLVFVEADELLAKVPFSVPKELIERTPEDADSSKCS
ncbi:hypothetical protein conserved [Leishmania donovani]|uniref:Uncharacterized protein n=3 Tax=Leishmania donovani species complex TaxID=38574 RepID=A4HX47_LEIIN|nr:conserved hypothetical protein [Leishmania infantum JPCM5]XP_003859843.1 hypothetical protein, conserved [Leishmania donovani]CAC9476381.1 hypothetical_protein_-_conserved [Leishmania infantum]AYU77736.1 hypothetical protein LdCL_160020900 [Leishmania donovani]TPP41038.1 hypothetical protein CGC20_36945 [Leishmania donovani]TPP51096.1 hypothetical protein CGC21_24640 [Leishmania donovani]CAJ1987746.1 hypothetical protein conserved [Leishmania donovani]|eukprot:XP_001464638.1 conserved hypothetical protein [Leishmania infantum JPCM5]